jgi:hypothetical protein
MSSNSHLFNPYGNLPKELTIFDEASLLEVEKLAASLSEEETLDFFAIPEERLGKSPADAAIFKAAFKRGRSIAKRNASEHLFSQMKTRNGAPAALAYLRQVADLWPISVGDANDKNNFVFSVDLGRDDG